MICLECYEDRIEYFHSIHSEMEKNNIFRLYKHLTSQKMIAKCLKFQINQFLFQRSNNVLYFWYIND